MARTFGRNADKRRAKTSGFGRNGTAPAKPAIDAQDAVRALRMVKGGEGDGHIPTKPTVVTDISTGQETATVSSVSEQVIQTLEGKLVKTIPPDLACGMTHEQINNEIRALIDTELQSLEQALDEHEIVDIQTFLLNQFMDLVENTNEDLVSDESKKAPKNPDSGDLKDAKEHVQPLLMEHIDAGAAAKLPRDILGDQIGTVVGELLVQEKINLNLSEQSDLVTLLLDDMLGLGPLEPLLADDAITDIMVNGPRQIYIERGGKLQMTEVHFRDSQHLLNIAQRIVTAVGRRVDESSPICDARLADGSRVNVIIPPLAIDGASISIRKFAKQKITLDKMIAQDNISPKMGNVLKIAAASRLNILISGGTGSGKTTMLNALSRMIDTGERIVTIEDAAELQLQQPHVVRLETRPPNLEGSGEVTMRDLVKNSLRMRPDRVILGEIRGSEAVDMLQAMNTGHDGSLGTIHANRPREALTRLENMVGLAGINLPSKAVRTQIADALDLIVQVSRMRDGKRRVQYVTEVVGMEGDVITTQDLFKYKFTGEDENGGLTGEFISTGVRPHFMERAEYFGFGRALMMAMS